MSHRAPHLPHEVQSRRVVEPTPAEIAAMNATLKPCPFCGAPSEVEWTPVPDFSGRSKEPLSISWHVKCTAVGSRCPMGQHWLCSTSASAVQAWNRRA